MGRLVCKVSQTALKVAVLDFSRDDQNVGEPVRTEITIPNAMKWAASLESIPLLKGISRSLKAGIRGWNRTFIQDARRKEIAYSFEYDEYIKTISNDPLINGAWGTTKQNPYGRFIADVYYHAVVTCMPHSNANSQYATNSILAI